MTLHFPRERRKHERLRLQPMYSSVIVETKSFDGAPMLGHIYDVCESGVRLELDEPLAIGEQVRVHLNLVGESEITARADVRWVHDSWDDPGPRRMALRFIDFQTPADRLRLKAFIMGGLGKKAA